MSTYNEIYDGIYSNRTTGMSFSDLPGYIDRENPLDQLKEKEESFSKTCRVSRQ